MGNKGLLHKYLPLPGSLGQRQFLLIFTGVFLLLWGIFAVMDWRTETIRSDFTSYSLEASRVLWDGGNPYDRDEVGKNYKYFPTNIVLLGPLTLLPIPVAQSFWTTLNLFLVLIAIAMQWKLVADRRVAWWLLIPLAIFCFRAVHGNLKLGQWNTSVYSLGVMGAIMLFRGGPVWGAIVLGLGTALKFLPAFLLIPFLIQKRWKPVVFSALAIVGWLVVVPLLLLGPQRFTYLMDEFDDKAIKVMEDTVGSHGQRVGISVNALVYLALNPAIREDISPEGTINGLDLSHETANKIAGLVSTLFFLGALYITWRNRKARHEGLSFLLLLGLWISTILIALPHVRVHYLMYSITPALGLLVFWYQTRHQSRTAWVALGMLGVAFLCQLITSQDIVGRPLSRWFNLHGGNGLLLVSLFIGCSVSLLHLGRETSEPVENTRGITSNTH